MTMTAGAHSIQPSLRSARAPSDSGGACGAALRRSAPAVTEERGGGPPPGRAARAHGVSPLPCRALLIWVRMVRSVVIGTIDGGETGCEIAMDTTW